MKARKNITDVRNGLRAYTFSISEVFTCAAWLKNNTDACIKYPINEHIALIITATTKNL